MGQNGVTQFRILSIDNVGGPFSPAVFVAHVTLSIKGDTHRVLGLSTAYQRLWLLGHDEVYRNFTCVRHIVLA